MLGRPAREQHLFTQSIPVLAGTVSSDQASEAPSLTGAVSTDDCSLAIDGARDQIEEAATKRFFIVPLEQYASGIDFDGFNARCGA